MPAFLATLASASYWLSPPDVSSPVWKGLVAFAAALVVSGIVARLVLSRRALDRHLARAVRRLSHAVTAMGVVALLIAFFSYENAGVLGYRFWYALWLLGALAWAASIARREFQVAPKLREEERARREKEKYLP